MSRHASIARSISAQVEHWDRLGKAVESAPGFTIDPVWRALSGDLEPGDLTAAELPFYDEALLQRLIAPDAGDLEQIDALGRQPGAVGLDENGNLVERDENGKLQPLAL